MSRNFFGRGEFVTSFIHLPDLFRLLETDKKGNKVMVVKDLSSCDDPTLLLKYDDFSLSKLLNSGVSLKSLNIVHDSRLGIDDSEIDKFNARLADVASDLFNS